MGYIGGPATVAGGSCVTPGVWLAVGAAHIVILKGKEDGRLGARLSPPLAARGRRTRASSDNIPYSGVYPGIRDWGHQAHEGSIGAISDEQRAGA